MAHREDAEKEQIDSFIARFFASRPAGPVSREEEAVVQEIVGYVEGQFRGKKYVLGLALDFTLLAQRISATEPSFRRFRPKITAEQFFKAFPRITERGDRVANTLTVATRTGTEGIRTIEEAVLKLFHGLGRTKYPSAYVYNTGQWHKNQELLTLCLKLSEQGRFVAVERLVAFGLANLRSDVLPARDAARIRLFDLIVTDYPRSDEHENGGLTYQAIAFAYFSADRPHLTIVSDKVRGGSKRQKRFGDVDGYYGLDLEVSAEVKDFIVTLDNIGRQLGSFVQECVEHQTPGVAFVLDIEPDAAAWLLEHSTGLVVPLTEPTLKSQVTSWDWQKQNGAVHDMLHFLAHIEQNTDAVMRLLRFIHQHDPTHESLAHFQSEDEE